MLSSLKNLRLTLKDTLEKLQKLSVTKIYSVYMFQSRCCSKTDQNSTHQSLHPRRIFTFSP